MNLAFDDHWIYDCPNIVHRNVASEGERAGLRVLLQAAAPVGCACSRVGDFLGRFERGACRDFVQSDRPVGTNDGKTASSVVKVGAGSLQQILRALASESDEAIGCPLEYCAAQSERSA